MSLLNTDNKNTYDFLKSAFSQSGNIDSIKEIKTWLQEQNRSVNVRVNQINFSDLKNWRFNKGRLQHDSGKFFTIDGIHVKTNWGSIPEWQQPIINQPEIGYLGFIVKKFKDVIHFLMQAKIEPGNVNHVQLSPTLQATRSNYTKVHKGKEPLYLDYFRKARSNQILLDQLQSEQGARFLKKRNRNIVIRVDEEIPVYDNFIWLTLAQIKELMTFDNLINMDTRTVISGISYGTFKQEIVDFFYNFNSLPTNRINNALLKSTLVNNGQLHSIEEIITFITQLKSNFDLEVNRIALEDLNHWNINNYSISHIDKKYFEIIAVDVEIDNREVINWSQPMIKPAQEGLCAFVCKEINGLLHFAVQAKLECGNHDIIEFAPTVQCLTGNYRQTAKGKLPFLEYVLNAPKKKIIYDSMQSEEGGRFYKEQNRNLIVLAEDEIDIVLPEKYIWMTINQLQTFLRFNNYLNIQIRSLLAAISFV